MQKFIQPAKMKITPSTNSFLHIGAYTKRSLHSPSRLILSAPLTLKEYTTPICSGSTIYCDVVLVMLVVLVAVTST